MFSAPLPSDRCPHCGSLAVIEPRGERTKLRWVCGVCGGPRTPAGLGGEAAVVHLREARLHGARATRSRAAAWVLAVIATFITLVAAAAWPAALVAKLVLLVLALTPTALAVRARARASGSTSLSDEAMDRAWLAAAEDFAARAKKGVTTAELAKALAVDEARADRLLTELAANDRTRIDVDDDAEVRFSVPPSGAARTKVRVSEGEPIADEDDEDAREESGAGRRAARGITK